MLIESVLLTLIERSVLTKADVLEAIEVVIETKQNIAADAPSVKVEMAAAGLLVSVANSVRAVSARTETDGSVEACRRA